MKSLKTLLLGLLISASALFGNQLKAQNCYTGTDTIYGVLGYFINDWTSEFESSIKTTLDNEFTQPSVYVAIDTSSIVDYGTNGAIYNYQVSTPESNTYDYINTGSYNTDYYAIISVLYTFLDSISSSADYCTVDITENVSNDNFKVYPNPTTGKVTINNLEGDNLSIKIMNSIGQIVYQSNINQNKIILNLSDMGNKGMYILYVSNEDNIVGIRKIILD